VWEDTQTVRATLGTEASLIPGDDINLLPNVTRAYKYYTDCRDNTDLNGCDDYESSPMSQVSLVTSDKALTPTAIISTATKAGLCDDLVIDSSGSFGAGGRDWKSIKWVVTTSSISYSESATVIETLLNSNNDIGKDIIPKSNLTLTNYTMTLTLTNFLGQSNSKSLEIEITNDDDIPSVTVAGSLKRKIFRYDSLALAALGTPSECTTSKKLTYKWRVFKNYNFNTLIKSQSPDPRRFEVDAYTLEKQVLYHFIVQVTAASGKFVESTISVYIKTGEIVAEILGNDDIPEDKPLTLDASSSADEDVPPGDDSALTYLWSCIYASASNFGESCREVLPTDLTTEAITVSANFLSPKFKYTFKVLTTSTDGRSDSTFRTVSVTSAGSPQVLMGGNLAKINTGDKLELLAVVTSNVSANVFWSATNSNSSLSSIALTPISATIPKGGASTSRPFDLKIQKNSLVEGRTYTFVLSASNFANSSLSSSAVHTVKINAGPVLGQLNVEPNEGFAIDTIFALSTSKWEDDVEDYPFKYEFLVIQAPGDLPFRLRAFADKPDVDDVFLPSGEDSQGNKVTVRVVVQDKFGASSTVKTSVKVTLPKGDPIYLASLAITDLSSLFESFDTDGVIRAVNNAASLLNTKSVSSPLRRRLATGDRPKSCPSNTTDTVCSGFGTCEYFTSTMLQVQECSSTDYTCDAYCRCDYGFTGKDCRNDFTTYTNISSLRYTLCDSLVLTNAATRASKDQLSSLLNTLGSVFNTYELNTVAFDKCMSSVSDVMTLVNDGYLEGADENAPTNTANLISRMVDFYINVSLADSTGKWYGIDANSSTSDTILQFALDLTLAQTAQLSNGEASSIILSDNLRVEAHNDLQSDLEGLTLTSPQTTDESSAGVVPQAITLPSNGLKRCSSDDYASFGITLWTVSPFSKISGTDTLGSQVMQMHVPTADQTDSNLASTGNGEWNITIQYDSDQPFDIDIYDRVFPAIFNYDGNSLNEVLQWACNSTSFTSTSATFVCADIGSMCGWDVSSLNPWTGNSRRRLQTSVSSGSTTSTVLTGGYKVVPGYTNVPTSQPSKTPTSMPSGEPTRAPVTSRPTREGDTNSPTASPTNKPSGEPTSSPSAIPTSSTPTAIPTSPPSPQELEYVNMKLVIKQKITNVKNNMTKFDEDNFLRTAEHFILEVNEVSNSLRSRRLVLTRLVVECNNFIAQDLYNFDDELEVDYQCLIKEIPEYQKIIAFENAQRNLQAAVFSTTTEGSFQVFLRVLSFGFSLKDVIVLPEIQIEPSFSAQETSNKSTDILSTLIYVSAGVGALLSIILGWWYFFVYRRNTSKEFDSSNSVSGDMGFVDIYKNKIEDGNTKVLSNKIVPPNKNELFYDQVMKTTKQVVGRNKLVIKSKKMFHNELQSNQYDYHHIHYGDGELDIVGNIANTTQNNDLDTVSTTRSKAKMRAKNQSFSRSPSYQVSRSPPFNHASISPSSVMGMRGGTERLWNSQSQHSVQTPHANRMSSNQSYRKTSPPFDTSQSMYTSSKDRFLKRSHSSAQLFSQQGTIPSRQTSRPLQIQGLSSPPHFPRRIQESQSTIQIGRSQPSPPSPQFEISLAISDLSFDEMCTPFLSMRLIVASIPRCPSFK
jgi:hypothetical protein